MRFVSFVKLVTSFKQILVSPAMSPHVINVHQAKIVLNAFLVLFWSEGNVNHATILVKHVEFQT